jgi:hypothetical protein
MDVVNLDWNLDMLYQKLVPYKSFLELDYAVLVKTGCGIVCKVMMLLG